MLVRAYLAGGEVEESYRRRLGVLPDRIIRYPYMVDRDRFTVVDAVELQQMRNQLHIPLDALVVTMINGLSPETDLDMAVKGITEAYAALPEQVRPGVRLVIAGDGWGHRDA